MSKILDQIQNDLESRKFIHLRSWICKFCQTSSSISSLPFYPFLEAIKEGNIKKTLEEIKKLYYINLDNPQYATMMQIIKQNSKDIARQWQIAKKFNPKDIFVNIVLSEKIIAFQDTTVTNKKGLSSEKALKNFSKLNFEEIERLGSNPDVLIHQGKIYRTKALSSINKITGVLRNSKIFEQMEKFEKYEKIARFIESLDYHLQSLFSFHQIGIIIYRSRIYLIKWVQFIDKDQILGESHGSKGKVKILEDLGVKIGVELQENGELGDLVIFKNTENDPNTSSEEAKLEPLLSLQPSIFKSTEQNPSNQKLDLSNPDDCKIFVNQVLGRIESGILLLNQKNHLDLKNGRDLDIYVQISLEKLATVSSINQRLNILRDLKKINQNPDIEPIITQELEKNYLTFIKNQFQSSLSRNIPQILKEIKRINLFEQNVDLLINSLVYLIDTFPINSQIIMNIVEILDQNWKLSETHFQILERPQIVAITNIVASYLNQEKFKEILTFLLNFLEKHPRFKSQNLIFLLLQILQDLFNPRHISDTSKISNVLYLKFFEKVINLINNFITKEKKVDQKTTQTIKSNLIILSDNLDFIAFLNEKIGDYLNLLDKFNPKLVNPRLKFQIIRILSENIPLICFHKNKPALATNFFIYLTSIPQNNEITLDFLTQFIITFAKSTKHLKNKQELTENVMTLLIEARKWEGFEDLHPILIKPLLKALSLLFQEWYENRNIPVMKIMLHRKFVKTWVDLLHLENRQDKFFDVLYIKNLIWACEEGYIKQVQKKCYTIPANVYLRSSEEFYLELSEFFDRPCQNYNEFRIHNYLFHLIQNNFGKLQLTGQKFKIILKKYRNKTQKLLQHAIANGYEPTYGKILNDILENLIYFSVSFFDNIYPHFTIVYEMNLNEGARFQSRIRMIQMTTTTLQKLLNKYEVIKGKKLPLLKYSPSILNKEYIQKFIQKLNSGTLDIFHRIYSWLIEICSIEYIQSFEKIEPIKNIFQSALMQFSQNPEAIVSDFQHLINEIYTNQKMLIDNKKKFFKIMLEITQKSVYPQLYKELKNKYHFIQELSEIESKYYTIEQHNDVKIEQVRKRLKTIIEKNIPLFTPWFIYANTFALQEKHEEAINAFKEALKYESNLSNFARLYHNLIVSYLSLNRTNEAVKIIENMEIGIKTDPLMVPLIREIEKLTGQHLLGQI
ncbi:MAG: hypothetical protein ACTSWC_02750 [Promethearchaeota archaeon]